MHKENIDIEDCISTSMSLACRVINSYTKAGIFIEEPEIARKYLNEYFVLFLLGLNMDNKSSHKLSENLQFNQLKDILEQEVQNTCLKIENKNKFKDDVQTEMMKTFLFLDKTRNHIIKNCYNNIQERIAVERFAYSAFNKISRKEKTNNPIERPVELDMDLLKSNKKRP